MNQIKFKSCPRCGHPMCEIDKVSHCLFCGYDTAPTEIKPPAYRRFIVDRNKEIAEIAHRNLLNNLDGSRTYCEKRGMSLHTIERWELGYIPSNFARMTEQWERRVLFPVRSEDGKHIVGFCGRKIETDDRAKYVNSATSQEYEKRRNLYGSWLLPEKTELIYLCEGQIDVISMDGHGYSYPVASLGTSLTSEQSEFLYEKTERVTIAYDSDEAGIIAAVRAIDLLRKAGFRWDEIKVLHIEGAKDVDECLTRGGTLRELTVDQFYIQNCKWEALAAYSLEGGVMHD